MGKKIKELNKEDIMLICKRGKCDGCPVRFVCGMNGYGDMADILRMIGDASLQKLVEEEVEIPGTPHDPSQDEREEIFGERGLEDRLRYSTYSLRPDRDAGKAELPKRDIPNEVDDPTIHDIMQGISDLIRKELDERRLNAVCDAIDKELGTKSDREVMRIILRATISGYAHMKESESLKGKGDAK